MNTEAMSQSASGDHTPRGPWWMPILGQFGAAGAVLLLALYVIVYLSQVIQSNTSVNAELIVLVREMRQEIKENKPGYSPRQEYKGP